MRFNISPGLEYEGRIGYETSGTHVYGTRAYVTQVRGLIEKRLGDAGPRLAISISEPKSYAQDFFPLYLEFSFFTYFLFDQLRRGFTI